MATTLACCLAVSPLQNAEAQSTNEATESETIASMPFSSSSNGDEAATVEGEDAANDLPAGVAEEQVEVSGGYQGFYLTTFGVNPDRRGRGDIVVVVRGPDAPADVFRWRRNSLGFWVHGPRVTFVEARSYQAIVSNRPLRDIAGPTAIWRYQLDPTASAQLRSDIPGGADASVYRSALRDIRHREGRYTDYVGPPTLGTRSGIVLYPGGLFRSEVRVPGNSPYAQYSMDTYLFRDGRLISSQRIPTTVTRVGILRRVHELINNTAILAYLLAILLAGLYWLALAVGARLMLGEPVLWIRRRARAKLRLVRGV